MTARQLPIRLRDEPAPTVTDTAFTECMDVLTVPVSVAMVEGDTTEDGPGTILDRVAGAESQDPVDAGDEHYRAWRLLLNRDDPLRVTPRTGGEFETRQYEGRMDRCFRVLRPVSPVAGPAANRHPSGALTPTGGGRLPTGFLSGGAQQPVDKAGRAPRPARRPADKARIGRHFRAYSDRFATQSEAFRRDVFAD